MNDIRRKKNQTWWWFGRRRSGKFSVGVKNRVGKSRRMAISFIFIDYLMKSIMSFIKIQGDSTKRDKKEMSWED